MFGTNLGLGIDIGKRAVRVALLKKDKELITVEQLAYASLSDQPLQNALSSVKKQLKKSIFSSLSWPRKQVMAVPSSQVAIKRFSVNANASDLEIYAQVGFQLAENLGLDIDELYYDFRTISADGVEVYACRKNDLKQEMASLSDCGFRPSVIELQSHALMRVYQHQLAQFTAFGVPILVDVGMEKTQMIFTDGVKNQFCRELSISASQHQLSCSKVRPITHEQCAQFTQQLVDNILRQHQLALAQFPKLQVGTLWLTGEAAKFMDIELLSQALKWEVVELNPLQGLAVTAQIANCVNEPIGTWSTAVGLALREVQ